MGWKSYAVGALTEASLIEQGGLQSVIAAQIACALLAEECLEGLGPE